MKHIETFCKLLYNSTFMPIRYFMSNELKGVWPLIEYPFDLTETSREILFSKQQDVCYLITKEFTYYGLVQNTKTGEAILLGPVSSTPVTSRTISGIMTEASIPSQYADEVLEFFQLIPQFSFGHFLGVLSLAQYAISGIEKQITDYFISEENNLSSNIQVINALKSYQARENNDFHNTYYFEQKLCAYVEAGDVNALQKIFSHNHMLKAGKIADTPLRQAKNIFISTITLLTRHSISGGMDIETAYQLSDIYIQEMEKLQNADAIQQLQLTSIYDFTNRVAESKIPVNMPRDIYDSIQFISTHLNEPLSVELVADYIGKSRSYLSRRFKSVLGFQISDYIMRRRLEEAKSLLTFTEKSLSEISEYLCFSSQSYFQNVFKKKYGVTPNAYRKSTR